MIITLSNTVSVNPLHVASVVVNDATNRIRLRMHDGEEHHLPCQYGKSIWATRDELVTKLNEPFVKELRIKDSPELAKFLERNR